LADNRLERQGGDALSGIVRLHRDRLDLCAGTAANVESRGDFAFVTGLRFLLLRLRDGATARAMHGPKTNRSFADVLIFEMTNRLFVSARRVQLDRGLFPFQLAPHAEAEKDRHRYAQDSGFHFLE
jgi:hypothetical protein